MRIISDNSSSSAAIFHDFVQLDSGNSMLLGAPLRPGSAMDAALNKRCDELALAISRINTLSSHDALILLRASFSAPKVMHTIRSSPCIGHSGLSIFDSLQRSGLCMITNSNLSDTQWLQASLPVKDGGLGMRRVASLASSAFLASASSSCALQDLILARCDPCSDQSFSDMCSHWISIHNVPCPCPPLASLQKTWDRPFIDADKAFILSNAPDSHHRARLFAASAPHSGDWLNALPISTCGLRLDNESIRVAVGLRLGVNLCEPHLCPCGSQVDCRGTHGLASQTEFRSPKSLFLSNDLIWRGLTNPCRHPFL